MKVTAINGSPKAAGNTAFALGIVAEELAKEGIEMEILHLGEENIRACIGCGKCYRLKNGQCVFDDDSANLYIRKMTEADGIILASPTYYAGISGAMKGFLDRAFYVHTANGGMFRHKAGASLSVARRAGTISAMDQMNKYLLYSEMVIASGNYWDTIYGAAPGEADQDEEGKQTLRTMARNMAWIMKLMEHGRETVPAPLPEKKTATNFIRR